MVKVLLIDDDVELGELVREVLAAYSIEIHAVNTPSEGFSVLDREVFDVILLDIMLPQLNGFQICQKIRYSNVSYREIPIIMLTARTELTDMVVGLETGADDYMRKPFEPRELVARINAVLRRSASNEVHDVVGTGDLTLRTAVSRDNHRRLFLDNNVLTIDIEGVSVFVNGNKLLITSMEFEIISALAEKPSEILSRDSLLAKIHGSSVVYTRSIDALIYRLRNKIREAGSDIDFIRTVRGRGYSLIGKTGEPTV